jgi:hypothetical protein
VAGTHFLYLLLQHTLELAVHGSSTSKALSSYLLSFVNLNSIFCLVTHFLFLPEGNPAGLDTADAHTH